MQRELRDQVTALLGKTRRQHDEAFAASNGVDPDWPIWFADRTIDTLSELLGRSFNRSQLIHGLMDADCDYQARFADRSWSECVAEHLIDCYAPPLTPASDKLVLYHFVGCPFCVWVKSAIDRLGVDVELRDIFEQPAYRSELIEARGRATVPVLRITAPDGDERWMPESRDIEDYLEQAYG